MIDGMLNQFILKKVVDVKLLDNDIGKYVKCFYCGMDWMEYNKICMLVQYFDDLVDGMCLIYCLVFSLSLNIDCELKEIWGFDFGLIVELCLLLLVDKLIYLIGVDLKYVMIKKSKYFFVLVDIVKEFQVKYGGMLGDFNQVLCESYFGMVEDVVQICKNCEECCKCVM